MTRKLISSVAVAALLFASSANAGLYTPGPGPAPGGGSGASGANPTATVGTAAVNGVATTFMRSDAAPAINLTMVPNWTAAHQYSVAGAASTPAIFVSGAHFTGGTGTTTFPQLTVQDSTATASTTWSTTGTAMGVNAHTGIGNLLDLQIDGSSKASISQVGVIKATELNPTGNGGIGYQINGVALIATTAPTTPIAGTSPSVVNSNGSAAFTVNVGTGATANTGSITLAAASHGYACSISDITNPGTSNTVQSATTATVVSFNNYSRTTGAPAAWAASDTISFHCLAY